MSPADDQLGLFGELDGLFAPEMVACTPIDEVRLAEIARTGALAGVDLTRTWADRFADLEPDDPEPGARAAEIRARLTERTTPSAPATADTYHDERMMPGESWAEYAERVGPDPDDPAEIGECATCAEIVHYDDGRSTRWGPLHDGCNEPGDIAPLDPAGWSADDLPTVAEIVPHLAPWIIGAVLAADDLADAVAAFRPLHSGGCGGPRGILDYDARGVAWLDLSAVPDGPSVRHKVTTWRDLAEQIRAAATEAERETLAAALALDRQIDDDRDADPRPWLPKYRYDALDQAARFEHDRADAAWSTRNEARARRAALCIADQRLTVAAIAEGLTVRPGALF